MVSTAATLFLLSLLPTLFLLSLLPALLVLSPLFLLSMLSVAWPLARGARLAAFARSLRRRRIGLRQPPPEQESQSFASWLRRPRMSAGQSSFTPDDITIAP